MKQRIFLVVLGMHRSGTSLITNILSKAGFYVGEQSDIINEGKEWNRDGYFERWSVMRVNDLILRFSGGSWHSPPKEQCLAAMNIDPTIEGLLKVYEGHDRAVIKDPRLCLTLPAWKRMLNGNVSFLLMSRHPESVAGSLMKRDGFSREKSLQLCLTYNERAAKYVSGKPAYLLKYEDLFSDRREMILKELSSYLGIRNDLEELASRTVDPSLQHHKNM